MAEALEAWEWRDPVAVAERRELQANAKTNREQARLTDRQAKTAERQRMRAKVFKREVK